VMPGGSLRIWPRACVPFVRPVPGVAGPGLAHRVDLIRSLSARGRDRSQMCHPVTPPRPVPTSAPDPGRRHEAA
jgi:hypothetical protein